MKQLIKGGAKLLYTYVAALIIFIVFLYPFIGITGDDFVKWVPLYSVIIFALLFFITYNDMKRLAIKEVKPQYELNPFPLMVLVYGLFSVIPISIITIILSQLYFEDQLTNRLRELAIDGLLGPVYFIIAWMSKSTIGYVLAILVIPVLSMLGYLAGYYQINIMSKIFKKKNVVQEKGFTKSPWNPSIEQKDSGKKKKKKKKVSSEQ